MHAIRVDVEVIDSDCKRCRGMEIETVKEGENDKVIHRCSHINKCLGEEEKNVR